MKRKNPLIILTVVVGTAFAGGKDSEITQSGRPGAELSDLGPERVKTQLTAPPLEPPMDMPHGIPDFAAVPTVQAVRAGDSNNPATWGGGVPGPDDVVKICAAVTVPAGQTLTAKSIGVCGSLTVAGTILVKDLLIYHNGYLELHPGSTITIRGLPFDLEKDPEQWGNGLLVMGKFRTTAVPKTHYCRVENVKAGDTTLTIHGDVPSDWDEGDELIIPRSRQNNRKQRNWKMYVTESERVRIQSIHGNKITLEQPAKWEHRGAVDRHNEQAIWVPVANLTRSIVIESESAETSKRGHFVATGRADIDITGIAFRNFGRTTVGNLHSTLIDSQGVVKQIGTNQLGRYPIHLHHLFGPENAARPYQAIVRNCVVDGGDVDHHHKWGVAVHRTSWILLENNVVYNVAGACIAEEDGAERNNEYDGNFLCHSVSRTRFGYGTERDLLPKSNEGTDRRGVWANGFWFIRCFETTLRNNIICDTLHGGDASGIDGDSEPSAIWETKGDFMHHRLVPTQKGQLPSLWVDFRTPGVVTPRVLVDGGDVFAIGDGVGGQTINSSASNSTLIVLKNLTIWHVSKAMTNYRWSVQAEDCQIFGDPSRVGELKGDFAVDATKQGNPNSWFKRIRIDNFEVGLRIRLGRGNMTHVICEDFDIACHVDVLVTPNMQTSKLDVSLKRIKCEESSAMWGPIEEWAFRAGRPQPPKKQANFIWGAGTEAGPARFNPVTFTLEDWNGDGKKYRVFAAYQAPDAVIPKFRLSEQLGVAGLTNREAWDQKGIATYGAVAPCQLTLPYTKGAFFFELPQSQTALVGSAEDPQTDIEPRQDESP